VNLTAITGTYAERYKDVIPLWFWPWHSLFRARGFEPEDLHQQAALTLIENYQYLRAREEETRGDPKQLAKLICRRAVKRTLLGRKSKPIVIEDADPVTLEDKSSSLDTACLIADMIDEARIVDGRMADYFESFFFGEGAARGHLTRSYSNWMSEYLWRKMQCR